MLRFLSFLVFPAYALAGGELSICREVRQMSTDRPDTTESPFTVPAGRWQFELEAVSVTRDDGTQGEDWGSVNLKYGLTDSIDFQLVTPAWHEEDGLRGWLDTEVRLKWNLSGQDYDGSPVAVALMPYLKLPTADDGLGNDDVEGGLIIPFALTEGPSFDFGWMLQGDVLRNEGDDGWTGAITVSATAGFELTDALTVFTEVVGTMPFESDAEMYFNTGAVFAINDDWTLDAGVNIGLNRAADDVRFFTGTSFRF